MSALSSLKLVSEQKPAQISSIQHRRNKLADRLVEQLELAKAMQKGTVFAPTKLRIVKDAETGLRHQVEMKKRLKSWWFTAPSGKLVLIVRYGSKVLELAKGKWAIEIGTEKDLLNVLETLKGAVLAGELDAQIEVASEKLRSGFDK
jgi:hypothetical protein